MKLLFVTALKEYSEDITLIFKKANIHIYSATDTIGFKDGNESNLLDNWFSSGEAKFDSVFVFSFTTEEHVDVAMQLIKEHNTTSQSEFPIRAFVLPVEKSSH